jgi:hypothetical protein
MLQSTTNKDKTCDRDGSVVKPSQLIEFLNMKQVVG